MTNLSSIDTLISLYDQQIKQEELARQKAKEAAVVETEKQIQALLGEEVWAELKPYAEYKVEWKGNTPNISFIFKVADLHMVNFQLWVADHGNYKLGAVHSSGYPTILEDRLAMGKFFQECRDQYENQRQETNKKKIKDLIDHLRYFYSKNSREMTLEEAKQVVAELCILAPDRAAEWDELLHKWINGRQSEMLRQAAEEKRKAEYEQIKVKYEGEYRAWYAKFLESKKANIAKAEKFQKNDLDQLGKSANYILKYGASYDGNMEIMTAQVLDELQGGYYQIVENGQIKTVRFYNPISIQTIELSPEDRTWWKSYDYQFYYGYNNPIYCIVFYYRPDINIHTALKEFSPDNPGGFPQPPEELQDEDYRQIIYKIDLENGE